MTKISDLTYKVVAFSEVPGFNSDECIDWALEMVFLGHEKPSLLILAGLSKPTNYFETIEYLKQALNELKLDILNGDKAILSYSSYYIKKISQCENIREHLDKVFRFRQSKDYEQLIYVFYLLYWAWDDLDYGNEYSPYWANANTENIQTIVVDTATKWLAENRVHYAQQGFANIPADGQ
jgi:hypothetical protein